MNSNEDRYEFYLKHLPPSIDSLFNNSSDELDYTQKEVIKSHRIISISGILESSIKENKYGLSKSIKSPYEYVLNPTVLDATVYFPMLAAQTASLYSHIHSHTTDLVKSLLKCKDSKEFNYLAISAIPSLFGFYSSNEHINLSMGFFAELFHLSNSLSDIVPLLIPFFSAPCLYRFFESSLSPFFDYFVRDTQKFDEVRLFKYSQMLTEHFVSSAPLIPNTHVVLLKLMNVKFGELETRRFLCEVLLKTQTFRWLESVSSNIPKELSLLTQNKKDKNKYKDLSEGEIVARQIIEYVFKNINQAKILQEVLCGKKGSLIEVPFQYSVFDNYFLYFLVSISDVRALYHLFIKNDLQLLVSMKVIDTEKVDENVVFWIKTYPSHQIETQLTKDPLIFKGEDESKDLHIPIDDDKERRWMAIDNLAYEREVDPMQILKEVQSSEDDDSFKDYVLSKCLGNSIESADKFEQFLLQKYCLSSSKKWQRISSLHEYIVLLPIVKALAIEKERSVYKFNFHWNDFKDQYHKLFEEASSQLQSPIIQRYQYLFIIQRFIPKVLSNSKQDFDIIREKLPQIIQRNIATEVSPNSFLQNQRLSIFWEAVELIRTTECDDLPYQFTTLMRGLSIIYHLSINTKINIGCENSENNVNSNGEDDDDDDFAKDQRTIMFLKQALYLSPTDKIFYLFMVILLFCMSDDQFRSLCTEHEHRLWVIFQNVMLKDIIFSDEEAAEKYNDITTRFNTPRSPKFF